MCWRARCAVRRKWWVQMWGSCCHQVKSALALWLCSVPPGCLTYARTRGTCFTEPKMQWKVIVAWWGAAGTRCASSHAASYSTFLPPPSHTLPLYSMDVGWKSVIGGNEISLDVELYCSTNQDRIELVDSGKEMNYVAPFNSKWL